MDPLLRTQSHQLYCLKDDPDWVVFDWDLMDARVRKVGSFLEYGDCGMQADVELVFNERERCYRTVSGETAQEVMVRQRGAEG